MPPLTPQVTLSGTLDDLFGAAVTNGALRIQLCIVNSVGIPRVAGTALLARTTPRDVPCPAGTYNFTVWGNDVITPINSYYTVTLIDDRGNVIQTASYQLSGTGTFDISLLTPYDPETPAPPAPVVVVTSGLVTVPYSATPVFNCALINGVITFDITLTGNVASSTCINVAAGQIVTFIIVQDATGGRLFAWPANVKNAGAVDGTTNAINVQSFIARANGNLYPIGPLTVN